MQVNQILDRYFPVLDYGFVALVDYMGGDDAIERSARVSYGQGTRKKSDTRNLIRYLLRQKHTTPFESTELMFHMSMPIFVARQMIRHRTANVNEYSGRYSIMPSLFYMPAQSECGIQSISNKQGRDSEYLDDYEYLEYLDEKINLNAKEIEHYRKWADRGLSREIARINLPLSMYTYWYWKMDLHNLFHFLKLRCDSHAQWEIREYANIIGGITKVVAPLSFEAWVDYAFCASNLTRLDKLLLDKLIHSGGCCDNLEEYSKEIGVSTREYEEFINKIRTVKPPDFNLNINSARSSQFYEQLIKDNS